ncbi:fimbrial assembly protein [Zoogloea oleivorans]|uniref:Fimbrial assembly protein n=1 Tax=Zoogloea oleivorans TaxID=1552750 RepID=A0A6C2D0U0_9RHOO|nr:PilN domain-containing protein [Zoogloea oleivorans]TYC60128.1 fimbrial assembly protein [Zoogloea oleivorans]
MTTKKSRYNLFGLDLAALARFVQEGWAEAAFWPVFRWMSPRQPVRVISADGGESVRLGVSADVVDFKGKVDLLAIELPEDLVLRRFQVLPRLSEADLGAAVALDARSASPFPENDLVWGFSRRGVTDGDQLRIESVLASRSQIQKRLAALGLGETAGQPEVWAGGLQPIIIRGFGESDRKSLGWRARWLFFFLLALGLILTAAITLTPLLQLRAQVIDANTRNQRLVNNAAPQVRLRADLVKLNLDLERVNGFVANYANPLLTLDELSLLLPDDVLVNTLEFKGNIVRLSGQAANAAKLLDLLGAQPGYQEVKAPSATTRVQGSGKEYFTIEFKINRAEKVQ